MERKRRRFPLVADDEIIVEPVKVMQLYDNEDLINNIQGPYQDKVYPDLTQPHHFVSQEQKSTTRDEGKTYAQQKRDEARLDVKKKRQDYLVSKMQPSSNPTLKTTGLTQKEPVQPKSKVVNDLSRFSEKLEQTSYILAELPRQYKQPKNPKTSKVVNKNYDFLKKSQVYNYPDNQHYKKAQELNMTTLGRSK